MIVFNQWAAIYHLTFKGCVIFSKWLCSTTCTISYYKHIYHFTFSTMAFYTFITILQRDQSCPSVCLCAHVSVWIIKPIYEGLFILRLCLIIIVKLATYFFLWERKKMKMSIIFEVKESHPVHQGYWNMPNKKREVWSFLTMCFMFSFNP